MHGRIGAQGPGKESVTGHWELMGAIPTTRLPTYPEGFPPDVVAELERVTGHTFLCNRPYNGIAVIEAFADEHLRTGSLILYTSAGLRAADRRAHERPQRGRARRRVPRRARGDARRARSRAASSPGRSTAGRGPGGARRAARTCRSTPPVAVLPRRARRTRASRSTRSARSATSSRASGSPRAIRARRTPIALASTSALIDGMEHGLAFTNLVETDQVYGHRKDVEGFDQRPAR